MFNKTSGEGVALNWQGPLLAAGIFAALFAILQLMAHQNQSNTSDVGSSLRRDPYGTSLLFDSYERAGYEVKRSQDEDSLFDQNAMNTTAFFVGGYSVDIWKMQNENRSGGEKFQSRLEEFLARGGRVVLVAPARKVKSESQGWEVENRWDQIPHESGPVWISPDNRAMPAASEKIYIASSVPWLKTDAGWTALYSGPVESETNAGSTAHVYMAKRRAGAGELIAASQESFLLNEAVKTRPNPALLDFLAGGRQVVWVDETLHGLRQNQGVLWLIQRYRLQTALLLFWATLLVLLWSMSAALVRRPTPDPDAPIMRQSEGAGVAARRLLQRSIGTQQVLAECWDEFRRRSPQDAQAISADPQSGGRLRAALAQPPLEGYRQLSRLVAERRASTRGLARTARDAPGCSISSPKKGSEEAQFA